MAKDPNKNSTRSFDNELNTDIKNYHTAHNSWDYARNAIPNSVTGDLGDLGNEPANLKCIDAPYTVIGMIYIYEDVWAIFSTDDVDSEIGLFKQATCQYEKLVNDRCLNFNRDSLITGVSKRNADCSYSTYFADNHRNYDRSLNINNIPYKQNCVPDANGCIICTPLQPLQLDCDEIRLSKPTTIPCVKVSKGSSSGSLQNGSYMATIAYTVNGQRVLDFCGLSNTQSLFSHNNLAGSIDIEFTDLDTDYDEFELVVISIVNQQTVAKRIGLYSTRTQKVTLDIISPTLVSIPLEFLPIRNPIAASSKEIAEVGDYMVRIAPKNKFDLNYQPLANNIVVKWVSVEYPAEYYKNGGHNASLLRDEVYPFFIEWIYDDGDISAASYHIPGTSLNSGPVVTAPFDTNNASTTSTTSVPLPDGGIQIAEGIMSYWESTEKYPDNKPVVWGGLCGKPIRHHKMPEQSRNSRLVHYVDSGTAISGPAIRVLGVKFENIQRPVDNLGNPIMNIVGYRILRGSREGNKSIIAKGMINNMINYDLQDGSGKTGLIPNYPYNGNGYFDSSLGNYVDPYLSATQTYTDPISGAIVGVTNIVSSENRIQTFHSPETQFRRPFLSPDYMRVYALARGIAEGSFQFPENHPKYKMLTNALFLMATVGGLGYAMLKLNGTRRVKNIAPSYNFMDAGLVAGATNGTFGILNPATLLLSTPALAGHITYNTGIPIVEAAQASGGNSAGGILSAASGIWTANPYWLAINNAMNAAKLIPGTNARAEIEQVPGVLGDMPGILSAFQGLPLFAGYMNEGFDTIVRFIKNANTPRHAALQYMSRGFYSDYLSTPGLNGGGLPVPVNNPMLRAEYLGSTFQDFTAAYKVNNKFRSKSVVTQTTTSLPPHPSDNSKFTIKTVIPTTGYTLDYEDPTDKIIKTNIASYYVGLKLYLGNQYGQIGSVRQIPVGCKQAVSIIDEPTQAAFLSDVIFAGDTYITRYAERNTMFFFQDWLYGQQDEYEYDYLAYKMLPYPMYWVNSNSLDFADFIQSLIPGIPPSLPLASQLDLPTSHRALDNSPIASTNSSNLLKHGLFLIKNSYFYLFNSGIRDFYVESEVNTWQRDWEDTGEINRFYDHTEYNTLIDFFRTPNIKNLDYYKYDYSLSVSKSFVEFSSWANVQPINYDPFVAASCYVYHPNRIIYSLPQQLELIRDNWRIFLANNYKDFRTEVTTLKNLNQNGAMIYFSTDSPIQIRGVETMNTEAGTKITIGDGALFSLPSQRITNADRPHEYASCQNSRSIINTPAGLFWMSQGQGKIFSFGNGLTELGSDDLKWWFAEYLPYKLTQSFPNFDLLDNPVTGIGCQSVYDNLNSLLYFCKKDYQLKPGYTAAQFDYLGGSDFIYKPLQTPVKLGNPLYFEDCSWTMSYDPKTKNWIGWHDWHPDLLMPTKDTFLSVKDRGLWVHNEACNFYCNYYGVDYPFEIIYRVNTHLDVEILRSLEYQLEVYKYDTNCFDRFLMPNENFDEAVVYNTEQVSGLLKLNKTPNNDPWAIINYPIINANSIDILYSKVETRFRFNQFWDITDDRGEFTTAERMIWNTAGNGYVKTLNPINLNYAKDPLQHKRFRNYANSILLRKRVSGSNKFLMITSTNKNTESPR